MMMVQRSNFYKPILGAALLVAFSAGGVAYASSANTSSATDAKRALSAVQADLSDTEQAKADLAAKQAQLQKEQEKLKAQLVETTQKREDSADRLAELEQRIAALTLNIAQYKSALDRQQAEMADILAVLQRLSLKPPAAALLERKPDATALMQLRANAQVKALLPSLKQQADKIAAVLAELHLAQTELQEKRAKAVAEQAVFKREAASLAELLGKRQLLSKRTGQDLQRESERAKLLVEQSQGLGEMIARLEAEEAQRNKALAALKARQAETARDVIAKAAIAPSVSEAVSQKNGAKPVIPAKLVGKLPVRGEVMVGFGGVDGFGETSRGLRLKPRDGATVIAPASGQVLMAGPFRGFGQLVILKHDASYHSVIAGLGSVNVAVGDKLSQGEPIGAIANSPEAGLYFELRKNGKPVDPLGQNGQAFLQ